MVKQIYRLQTECAKRINTQKYKLIESAFALRPKYDKDFK